MGRKFIAAVVAAALTVTAVGTAPARADSDLLKTLAIVAGAAVVGKVIYDQTQRNRQNQIVSRNVAPPPVYYQAPERQTHRAPMPQSVYRPVARPQVVWAEPIDIDPRPLPKRADRKLLPGDCLQSVETRDGRVRFFAQDCLERNYSYVNRLPQDCAVRFRSYNGPREGYDARCLRDEGYQLARM